ncbi:MAG: HD-GYP domain-containing protein [Spirochaetes bacterium]|jgi:putative nucleotidyltransferase with HDIG domain|nr:HD-GYP domain-containing protein [Spirochaetota bacterium]
MSAKKISLSFMRDNPHEAVLIRDIHSDAVTANPAFRKMLGIRHVSTVSDLLKSLKIEEKDKKKLSDKISTTEKTNGTPVDIRMADRHLKLFFHYDDMEGIISVISQDITELDTLSYQVKDYSQGLVKNTVGIELYQRELEKKNNDLQEELKSREMAQELLNQSLGNLRRIIEEMIKTISLIGIIKDPYTGMHQQRVANLSKAIGEEMNLHPEQLQGIYTAGMLHDIGKISIPTEILSKPGMISEVELMLIRTHPKISYEILKQIEFPWPVAKISYQHHEKLNGSGYPEGLKGDDILLEAQIIGVADVVEAITSHRPYRQGLGINSALEEISRLKGVCYNKEVVDICIRLFKSKKFSFDMERI